MLLKNRACDPGIPANEQVATDFLQLVRLGVLGLGLEDAPDFAVSISSVPSIGVFQIEPDEDEAATAEASGALAAALAGAEEG